jgi:integrase
MGVYQDTDKTGALRWRINIKVIDGETTRRVRRWVKGFTRDDALYQEALLFREHGMEPPNAPTSPRLKDYYLIYRSWAKLHRKPSTVAGQVKVLEADILPLLGDMPLHTIDSHAKDRLAGQVAERGCSPSTINNVLGALGSVLKHALDAKIISERPPSRFVKPSTAESRFLDSPAYEALLDAARSNARWYPAVLLAGDTGLRLGEIRGLCWDAVDLKKGWLRVKRAMWKKKLGKPKNGEERSVPLRRRVVEILEALPRHSDFVFCHEDGTHDPYGPEVYGVALARICAKAGIARIGWHTLRHTFLSSLCAKKVDLRTIQVIAGHAQITTTQRYLHTTEKQLREAINVLEE